MLSSNQIIWKKDKKRFLFNGLNYFGSKLVADLSVFDRSSDYKFFDTYRSRIAKIKFLLNLKKTSLFISFNGVTKQSGSLDKVIDFKIPMIMFWHGTDAAIAINRHNEGVLDRRYIDYCQAHYTDAPWIKNELEIIGINSNILPFKHVSVNLQDSIYEEINILTYLAKDKEIFYGWNTVKLLATHFNNLNFTVVGSDGMGLDPLFNVKFMDWCNENEMRRLRSTHAIFIRFTEHDGFSLSVIESLAEGMEVIWNYPALGAEYARNIDEAIFSMNKIISRLKSRNLKCSIENKLIARTFDKQTVMTNLINVLHEQTNH